MTRDDGNKGGAWKNVLLGLAIVVLFFVLVEASLGLAGVRPLLDNRDPFEGFSRSVRVFELDARRGVIATAPRAVLRSFNYQEFRSDKPPGGFRLFTLGGSSAYGFPWGASIAFTRVLGDALAGSWPGRPIEAINASGMSYGTTRLRILAHEVAGYHPDVIVVYEGHNEFIETRLERALPARGETFDGIHALLYRWRLYSALTRALGRVRGDATSGQSAPLAGQTAGELIGLDVAREQGAGKREADRRRAGERLEENLLDIEATARAAGARVVFCTVASNLKDWAPNQSLFDPALPASRREEALALLERANRMLSHDAPGAAALLEQAHRIAPEYAGISYTLARAYEALLRWDDARAGYARARDDDAQPSRAPASFNETIRRVATQTNSALVDVERLFERESPHGLVGFNLIEDYVHPTPQGHRLIALELWKYLNESGLLGVRRTADAAEFWKTVGRAPEPAAASGLDARKASELLYNEAFVLEHQGLIDQAIEKYRACLELAPGYAIAAFNLGRLLHAQRRPDLAAEQFRRALASDPNHVLSMVGLGLALLGLDDIEGAIGILRRATEKDPDSAAAWNGLGHALALGGEFDAAAAAFQKSFDLEPTNADAVAGLGSVRMMQGQVDRAIEAFRASLALRHDQPRVRDDLADALSRSGQLDDAEELYRSSVQADPNDERARTGLERIQILRSQTLR